MASLCRRLCNIAPKILHITTKQALNAPKLGHYINRTGSCSTLLRGFASSTTLLKKETVTVHFLTENGEKLTTKANVGDNLLDVIVDNDLDIDGFGACEGTLACSTCHLIFTDSQFEVIPDKATDEELDMLDLAYQLTDTSRLGCQVIVTKDMDGWEIKVPAGVADARDP